MAIAHKEQELIRNFLAGDADAYDTISVWITTVLELRSWHGSIRAARDDIRQEVLVSLVHNFKNKKYRGLGLKTYVSSITKFTCLKTFDRMPEGSEIEKNVKDEKSSTLENIVRDEEYAAVRKGLSRLNDRCRKILALRYHDDLDHGRIADILGIRPEASRQWLKRCLDKLRKMVGRENSL